MAPGGSTGNPGFYRLAIVGGTNVMALMVRETALAAHGSVLLANNGIFEYVSFWPFLVVVISILLCLGDFPFLDFFVEIHHENCFCP